MMGQWQAWWQAVRQRDPVEARWWRMLAVLAPVSLVERWLFIFLVRPPMNAVYSDMQGYVERAERLGRPGITLNRFDTFFPPGTHVLMALPFRFLAERKAALWIDQWVWWLFAVGTLLGVALLAYRLFRHPMAPFLAVVLLSLYWPFSSYAGYFTSENPMAFFMVATLLAGLHALDAPAGWRRAAGWLLTGLLGGVALTIRPQFIISIALLCLPLLRRRFPFFRVKDVLPLALAGALPCLAAVALNHHAARQDVGLAGNGGFNFYQGHCDVHTVETRSKDGWYVWASPARIQYFEFIGRPAFKTLHQGHMAWESGYFLDQGLQCIQQDGLAHLGRLAVNVLSLFMVQPWPQNNERWRPWVSLENWGYSAVLVFLLVPLAWRRARTHGAERFLVLQLAGMLPVAFLIYGDSRFRIPYDMFGILLLVGLVLARLGRRRDAPAAPPAPPALQGASAVTTAGD